MILKKIRPIHHFVKVGEEVTPIDFDGMMTEQAFKQIYQQIVLTSTPANLTQYQFPLLSIRLEFERWVKRQYGDEGMVRLNRLSLFKN